MKKINRNEKKELYGNKRKKTEQVVLTLALMLIGIGVSSQMAFASAAGASVVANGIGGLTDIVKAFVSAVGAIIVLWGLFEWGNAMQTTDGGMQSQAFKRIGGGIIMTLGPQIFLSLIA